MTILFIGHDANRAGAQYLLLHLLTYLRETGVRTGLLLGAGGPLLADYERVTTVYRAFAEAPAPNPTLSRRILTRLRMAQLAPPRPAAPNVSDLLPVIRSAGYTCIVANTIANGGLLRELQPLDLPFALYVHELETSIQMYTRPDELQYELTHAAHIFCGSEAVRQNLLRHHGRTAEHTSVLNSLIRTETILSALKGVHQQAVRERLGIPAQAMVVGGCGNAEWRKGVDLFLLIARQVLTHRPDVRFVWVGVPDKGEEARRLRYDLDRMQLTGRVHLLPPGGDYLNYVACFNLFTLTSREDPYPLVMLEAGLNHNPVFSFSESGGSGDFVGHDTGCLMPYLDVTAMAKGIIRLADDPAETARLGQLFYERAMAHDVAVLVPQLLAQLDSVFSSPDPTPHAGR